MQFIADKIWLWPLIFVLAAVAFFLSIKNKLSKFTGSLQEQEANSGRVLKMNSTDFWGKVKMAGLQLALTAVVGSLAGLLFVFSIILNIIEFAKR